MLSRLGWNRNPQNPCLSSRWPTSVPLVLRCLVSAALEEEGGGRGGRSLLGSMSCVQCLPLRAPDDGGRCELHCHCDDDDDDDDDDDEEEEEDVSSDDRFAELRNLS